MFKLIPINPLLINKPNNVSLKFIKDILLIHNYELIENGCMISAFDNYVKVDVKSDDSLVYTTHLAKIIHDNRSSGTNARLICNIRIYFKYTETIAYYKQCYFEVDVNGNVCHVSELVDDINAVAVFEFDSILLNFSHVVVKDHNKN